MADKTSIEWTDATWNPTVGCSVISPGCTNCYAMKLAGRLEAMGSPIYAGHTTKTKAGYVWNGKVAASNWGQVIKPLSWRKPRRIFVNSMSDLFHEDMSIDLIDTVFAVMALAPQHTFQVLTKRAERMREYLTARNGMGNAHLCRAINEIPAHLGNRRGALEMPLPNVWLGASIEDQPRAERRRDSMRGLADMGWRTFGSYEPALGPVQWDGWEFLTWLISGGESGPNARPSHPDWHRRARDWCRLKGVAYFFKQWGAWAPFRRGDMDLQATVLPDGRVRENDPDYPHSRLTHPYMASMFRIGKKRAGAVLDGYHHRDFPR